MILVFIGPPGSGKGTIAQMFAQKGWVHFSIGQALRDHAEKKGKYAHAIIARTSKGLLVSQPVFSFVFNEFIHKNKTKNIVFDGLPRSKSQASFMRKVLQKHGKDIDAYFFLDISPEEVIRRLKNRRECPKCGKIYGVKVTPARKGWCDNDNGKLIQRKDDKPSIIQKRFRVFHHQTLPVIEWASRQYSVFHVNAQGGPPIVFKRVWNLLSFIKK